MLVFSKFTIKLISYKELQDLIQFKCNTLRLLASHMIKIKQKEENNEKSRSTYSQTNAPLGISCKALTPQPL